jgi:hypothetical protein
MKICISYYGSWHCIIFICIILVLYYAILSRIIIYSKYIFNTLWPPIIPDFFPAGRGHGLPMISPPQFVAPLYELRCTEQGNINPPKFNHPSTGWKLRPTIDQWINQALVLVSMTIYSMCWLGRRKGGRHISASAPEQCLGIHNMEKICIIRVWHIILYPYHILPY